MEAGGGVRGERTLGDSFTAQVEREWKRGREGGKVSDTGWEKN